MKRQSIEQRVRAEAAQRQNDEAAIRAEIANRGRNERREYLLNQALWEKEHRQFFYVGGMSAEETDNQYSVIIGTYRLLMYVKPACFGYEIEANNKFSRNARAAVRRVTRK